MFIFVIKKLKRKNPHILLIYIIIEFYFLLLALQDFSKKMFNIISHRIKAIKIN